MGYVEESFRDKRRYDTDNTDCITGPVVTIKEDRTAIGETKNG